ncbi:MAG: YidC/Oxa1 family membrane protein insertase, partial [Candidatus Promineifilaceae bacterium]
MKRKQWLILLLFVVAALLLSGCGVNRQGVDVTTVAPEGFWQTFVVWPLAKALIWLNTLLVNIGFGVNSWGFAIILFTAIIKVITLPLTISQIRGMQAQRELQPKIQELQKKYGKDREKISQEQMKLYQEAGVNPLSGCLPLLIQMPILFGLYAAIVALGI